MFDVIVILFNKDYIMNKMEETIISLKVFFDFFFNKC